MAHLVLIEDAAGDVVDAEVLCSDYCARQRDHYAGWNGCNEVEFDSACAECGAPIPGYLGAAG